MFGSFPPPRRGERRDKMETKLLTAFAICFAVGCSLDSNGLGELYEDSQPDMSEEIEPDFLEADVSEIAEEDAGDEDDAGEPDEAIPDETTEDIGSEDVEPEDTGEEGGDADDGGIDPCALPTIPSTGIFVFYCFNYDLRSPFSLEFQVGRAGTPIVSWRASSECSASSPSRRLECTLTPLVWDATYIFNIRLDPGVGIGWSCGPELLAIWGTPRVWLDGAELTVTPVTNGDGGCNHSFETPPAP